MMNMKQVEFTNEGEIIKGALFYPSRIVAENRAILFIHGWTSEQKWLAQYAEALSGLGAICMTFDLRGHGISEGDIKNYSRKDFLNDVLAAYDFLVKAKGVDRNTIRVIGSSFGSYLACLLTLERSVRDLVLRVPANYPDEGFDEPHVNHARQPHVIAWRDKPVEPNENKALKALHNYHGFVLIVESGKDESVPHQTIANYVNAIEDKGRLSYIVMQDAPHSLKDQKFREEYKQILVNWFENS